jgi:hypothetical protein
LPGKRAAVSTPSRSRSAPDQRAVHDVADVEALVDEQPAEGVGADEEDEQGEKDADGDDPELAAQPRLVVGTRIMWSRAVTAGPLTQPSRKVEAGRRRGGAGRRPAGSSARRPMPGGRGAGHRVMVS